MRKLYYILGVLLFNFSWINAFPSGNDSIKIGHFEKYTYYGEQLFPNRMDSIELKQMVSTRVFLCFKMADTLVVVTDNPLIWHSKYQKIRRYDFRHIFNPKSYLFNDKYLPYNASVECGKDSLLYFRSVRNKWDYDIEMGVLRSFKLVKMNRSVEAFCEKINIDIKYLDNINTLFLLTPSVLGIENDLPIQIYQTSVPNIVQIDIKKRTINSIRFEFCQKLGVELDFESDGFSNAKYLEQFRRFLDQ